MKTRFISLVAHEIKAPIATIESYLNIIKKDGTLDCDIGRIKEIATRCLERSGALLALVQDLLEITRQETIQQNRFIDKVDVWALASKLVEFHRTQAAECKINIELCPASGLKSLYADVSDIERVLTDLLSNAIKYYRKGGKIWVRPDSTYSVLRIEVEDTGIDRLRPDEVKRAGEEFFRVKNEKTRAITV